MRYKLILNQQNLISSHTAEDPCTTFRRPQILAEGNKKATDSNAKHNFSEATKI